MFLNLSNHPLALWSPEQLNAASQYGELKDIPFPDIPPTATTEEIYQLAQQVICTLPLTPSITVHVMGEMTLTYALVSLLKAKGIRCVASTTERLSTLNSDGSKTTFFQFVQFREY